MLVPYWLVRTLCILCFILNTISICLCLSALFLLIMSYFGFEHLFNESSESPSLQPKEITFFNISLVSPFNENNSSQNIPVATTSSPLSFPDDNSEQQFSLIVYLLFYLTTAILGVLGAHTLYQSRKMYFLVSHALLLFTIICFNLIAWFEFRAYSPLALSEAKSSPLSLSPSDDSHLLLAALFDFIDLLVALCLITALTINRLYVNRKRNSINPIENGNGMSSASWNVITARK